MLLSPQHEPHGIRICWEWKISPRNHNLRIQVRYDIARNSTQGLYVDVVTAVYVYPRVLRCFELRERAKYGVLLI